LNKGELVASVADATSMSKSSVAQVIDAVIESIGKALNKGDDVAIVGFGTWKKKTRAARKGRNPQTGQTISIAAKNTVTFSAGKGLKDQVN